MLEEKWHCCCCLYKLFVVFVSNKQTCCLWVQKKYSSPFVFIFMVSIYLFFFALRAETYLPTQFILPLRLSSHSNSITYSLSLFIFIGASIINFFVHRIWMAFGVINFTFYHPKNMHKNTSIYLFILIFMHFTFAGLISSEKRITMRNSFLLVEWKWEGISFYFIFVVRENNVEKVVNIYDILRLSIAPIFSMLR
jgi:hypothetical protein